MKKILCVSCFIILCLVGCQTNQSLLLQPTATSTSHLPCTAIWDNWLAEHAPNYNSCIQTNETCEQPTTAKTTSSSQRTIVEIILDASGSMAAKVGGKSKMSSAKEVLTTFLTTLPENTLAGLRVYGHKGSNSTKDKEYSCRASDLLYDISAINPADLNDVIAAFQPTGWTPIALSLQLAYSDLQPFADGKTSMVIFLVSDGEETCDGNPAQEALALASSPMKPTINVIGFDVQDTSQAQLQAIAEAGKGKYFSAKNQDELQAILSQEQKNLQSNVEEDAVCTKKPQALTTATLATLSSIEISCLEQKLDQEKKSALEAASPDCLSYVTQTVEQRYALMSDFLMSAKKEELADTQQNNSSLLDKVLQEFFQ